MASDDDDRCRLVEIEQLVLDLTKPPYQPIEAEPATWAYALARDAIMSANRQVTRARRPHTGFERISDANSLSSCSFRSEMIQKHIP